MKILLAHHDALLAAGIAATLDPLDEFEIVTTRSADLVIADYQAAMALVGDGVPAGRVLILCHAAGEAQIRAALTLGIRGFLLNGCGPEDLVAAIRNLHRGKTAIAPILVQRLADSLLWEPLTSREQAVMRELLTGSPNKAIATRLHISVDTASTHVKNILGKLGASNRAEAVAIAQRRGLVAT